MASGIWDLLSVLVQIAPLIVQRTLACTCCYLRRRFIGVYLDQDTLHVRMEDATFQNAVFISRQPNLRMLHVEGEPFALDIAHLRTVPRISVRDLNFAGCLFLGCCCASGEHVLRLSTNSTIALAPLRRRARIALQVGSPSEADVAALLGAISLNPHFPNAFDGNLRLVNPASGLTLVRMDADLRGRASRPALVAAMTAALPLVSAASIAAWMLPAPAKKQPDVDPVVEHLAAIALVHNQRYECRKCFEVAPPSAPTGALLTCRATPPFSQARVPRVLRSRPLRTVVPERGERAYIAPAAGSLPPTPRGSPMLSLPLTLAVVAPTSNTTGAGPAVYVLTGSDGVTGRRFIFKLASPSLL